MKNDTRDRIIRSLRGSNGVSGRKLALQLNVPEPSVRRLIGELRAEGWDISSHYFGYKLNAATQSVAASQPVTQSASL